MSSMGLRELKKNHTRKAIADAAADLFRRNGYESTTVDEIAQTAMVSKKTVFNYFPTKEDLVFDRADDRTAELLAAVRERPDGVSVLDSFHRLCRADQETVAAIRADLARGPGGFFDLVNENPALQRKAHEVSVRLTRTLAAALAEAGGRLEDDPVAAVLAWTFIGAQRTLYRRLRARVAESDNDPTVLRAHRRDVDRVFDQLRVGLVDYP